MRTYSFIHRFLEKLVAYIVHAAQLRHWERLPNVSLIH